MMDYDDFEDFEDFADFEETQFKSGSRETLPCLDMEIDERIEFYASQVACGFAETEHGIAYIPIHHRIANKGLTEVNHLVEFYSPIFENNVQSVDIVCR